MDRQKQKQLFTVRDVLDVLDGDGSDFGESSETDEDDEDLDPDFQAIGQEADDSESDNESDNEPLSRIASMAHVGSLSDKSRTPTNTSNTKNTYTWRK